MSELPRVYRTMMVHNSDYVPNLHMVPRSDAEADAVTKLEFDKTTYSAKALEEAVVANGAALRELDLG